MTRPMAVLIDDHPLLTRGLAHGLASAGLDTTVVDPQAGLDDVLAGIDRCKPDCAVVDLGLPIPGGGQSLIPALVTRAIPVAVLTGESERWQWAKAVHAGAEVVLSKNEPLEDIIDVVSQVAAGQHPRMNDRAALEADYQRLESDLSLRRQRFAQLTRREEQILAGLMDGLNVQHLAARDVVSVQTVRSQVKSMLRKLGANSQLEVVAMAHAVGWKLEQPET